MSFSCRTQISSTRWSGYLIAKLLH
jgi:hypothetical protein